MAWPAGREGSVEVAWAVEWGEEGPPVVCRQFEVSRRMIAWAQAWGEEGPLVVCRRFGAGSVMVA